jgi:hypothetical protein
MKKNSKSIETSRRQFTRAMVTAAVAAPIVGSMVGCQRESPTQANTTANTSGPPTGSSPSLHCPCTPNVKTGYTEISLGALIHPEEHIPPMEIGGGGSVVVDSQNKLDTSDTGSGPFNYAEAAGVTDPNRYGEIEQVIVITELPAHPYLDGAIYKGFTSPPQLWLWYQDISPSPVDPDDTTYPPVTFPDADPDVKFIGGRGANKFKMVVKRKKLDSSQSHKKNRPNRLLQSPGGGLARHFRIGQWRLVDSTGTALVGNSGADNYDFYVTYADFIP